jgi:hypothetical protein
LLFLATFAASLSDLRGKCFRVPLKGCLGEGPTLLTQKIAKVLTKYAKKKYAKKNLAACLSDLRGFA